jgi:hypothetical protein
VAVTRITGDRDDTPTTIGTDIAPL